MATTLHPGCRTLLRTPGNSIRATTNTPHEGADLRVVGKRATRPRHAPGNPIAPRPENRVALGNGAGDPPPTVFPTMRDTCG